jgi:hypothetical protein
VRRERRVGEVRGRRRGDGPIGKDFRSGGSVGVEAAGEITSLEQ